MRSHLYLVLLGATVLSRASAQQPDSLARRDSVLRADSIHRADSLRMERELGRIRNEPRNRTTTDTSAETSRPAHRISKPAVRFELGVALPSTLVEDANGTTIQSGFAPVLGVAATWMMTPTLQSVIGLRGSFASVNADGGFADWNAGRSSQIGIGVGLEQRIWQAVGVFADASGTWLSGPDDVTPFRDDSGLHWGGGAGVNWSVLPARRMSLFGGVEAFMLGGKSNNDPVARPAWVHRYIVGVRYGT